MKQAWLVGTVLEGEEQVWAVSQDSFLIGRAETADLTIDHPRISRTHAVIERLEDSFAIKDTSKNGTWVNDLQIEETPIKLNAGDEIVIAGLVTLKYSDPDETIEGEKLGRVHGVWIDYANKDVWVDSLRVDPPLSSAQFTMLNLLYRNANTIISRDTIIATVWSDVDPAGVSGEAVDGLIKRTRARLRKTQPETEYIQVIRGHGLRLSQPE